MIRGAIGAHREPSKFGAAQCESSLSCSDMSDWNVDSKLVGHTDGLPTMPGMRPMKIGDDPRRQAKSKMRQPRNKLVIGFDESSRKCEACLATREHPSSCSNRLLAQRILDRWPQAERGAAEEGAGGDCGEGATEENRGTRAKSWPPTICVPEKATYRVRRDVTVAPLRAGPSEDQGGKGGAFRAAARGGATRPRIRWRCGRAEGRSFRRRRRRRRRRRCRHLALRSMSLSLSSSLVSSVFSHAFSGEEEQVASAPHNHKVLQFGGGASQVQHVA